MRTFVLYGVFACLLIAIQAIFFKGVKPDMVLVIVCYYSLKFGKVKGTAYGAFTGLVIDTVNGFLLGPNIIAKSVAGYVISALRENFYHWNIINNALAILLFSIVNIIIVSLCLEIFSGIATSNRSFGIYFAEVMYTLAASFVMYPLFKPSDGVNITG